MSERSAARFWIGFIVALLVATAVGQGVMLYAATHDPTFSIVPDYYQKAVAWDTTMARSRSTDALGWTARATFDRDGSVRVTLADRGGAPLAGATVTAIARHNLDGDRMVPLTLRSAGDGAYAAPLASTRLGLWEVDVTAVRGGDVFVATLHAERGR